MLEFPGEAPIADSIRPNSANESVHPSRDAESLLADDFARKYTQLDAVKHFIN